MLRLGAKVLLTLFPMVRAMDPVVPVPDVVVDELAGLEHPETIADNNTTMTKNQREPMDFRFGINDFSSWA
jgi:hypothetical protein